MSISMLRWMVPALAAFAALPGNAAEQRTCVGTYSYSVTVVCPGAPGNLIYANFYHRGTFRVDGTFATMRLPGSPEVQTVFGKVSLDPGIPDSFAYRGEGVCAAQGNHVSGSIRWRQGTEHEVRFVGSFETAWAVLRGQDDKKRGFRGAGVDAECTFQ